MTPMYFSAGVRLMTDEQSLVGLAILANLISIIYFLHIQQENYPDKLLRTKNTFGEMYYPARQNHLHFPQCHVYIFHPMTPIAKLTIFLCHIDADDPEPDRKTEGELPPLSKCDSLTAVIKHLPGMCSGHGVDA